MTERKKSFWYTVYMVAPFAWSILMITKYAEMLHLGTICFLILAAFSVYYFFNRESMINADIRSAFNAFAVFCAYMLIVSASTGNTMFAIQAILIVMSAYTFSFAGYHFTSYAIVGYLYAAVSFLLIADFVAGGFSAGLNTNTVSLFAINGVMYLLLVNDMQKSKHIIANGIIIAVILVLISQTGCRSVYIAFAAYLLLRYVIFRKQGIKSGVYRLVCTLSMSMPYILMQIYLSLYNSPYKEDLDKFFFEHTGKILFTEREVIWQNLFNRLEGRKYWFGFGTRCANAHNIIVDIWYCYGLIGAVLFVCVFLYLIFKLYKHFDDRIIKSSVCCFFGIFISETFECFSFALAVEACNISLYMFLAIAIGRYMYLENKQKRLKGAVYDRG